MSSQCSALSTGAKSVTSGQSDGNSDARIVYGDRLRFVPRNILVIFFSGF